MNMGRRLNANINVTPLCDVMLVLLIIFMIVTPLIDRGTIELPEALHPTQYGESEKTVTLTIRPDRTLLLQDIPVPESVLLAKVREIFDSRSNKILHLKAARNLDYGDILRVMAICRESGVEEIALLTQKKVSS